MQNIKNFSVLFLTLVLLWRVASFVFGLNFASIPLEIMSDYEWQMISAIIAGIALAISLYAFASLEMSTTKMIYMIVTTVFGVIIVILDPMHTQLYQEVVITMLTTLGMQIAS